MMYDELPSMYDQTKGVARTPEQAYKWHVRDKEIIDKYLQSHQVMVIYLSWLLHQGPETVAKIPTKPKESVQAVLNKTKPTT